MACEGYAPLYREDMTFFWFFLPPINCQLMILKMPSQIAHLHRISAKPKVSHRSHKIYRQRDTWQSTYADTACIYSLLSLKLDISDNFVERSYRFTSKINSFFVQVSTYCNRDSRGKLLAVRPNV